MTNLVDPRNVEAGHSIYTPLMLHVYDGFVLGFSNRLLWRCPTAELLRLYQRNVGSRHLDIGVGTGYFLDKVEWPLATPDITLLDLNRNCLDMASARIARFEPQSVQADVLKPLPAMEPFDSVDNLKPVMRAGSRLFGATIVQGASRRNLAAQTVLNIYNRKGIFSNADDTFEALRFELDKRFDRVVVCLIGSVALFEVTV